MRNERESLRIKFKDLLASTDAQRRGKQFEDFLGDLLELEGCSVWRNARAATPRQTDFVIECDHSLLLIEAKWKKKEIDIADIDNLRIRLGRAASSELWGCFFSMSDYNPTVLRDLAEHRRPPIILFNAFEINSLFYGRSSVRSLIQEKIRNFKIHANIWFLDPKRRKETLPYNRRRGEEIRLNGKPAKWIQTKSDDYDVVFARSPYIGFSNGAQAVTAHLNISSVADLARLFRLANELLGAAGWGPFTIYQAETSWHGLGAQRFMECIGTWKRRYAEKKFQTYHHSEELAYFEELNDGVLGISCRQRVGSDAYLHSGTLEIALPGIPVELAKYNQFLKAVADRPSFFVLRDDLNDQTVQIRERIKLEIIGWVVGRPVDDTDQMTITGAITKNPFVGGSYSEMFSDLPEHKAQWIAESDTIICDLLHWLDYGDEIDEMLLKTVSINSISGLKLVSFTCTWSNLIKRAHPPNSADFERVIKKFGQRFGNGETAKRRKSKAR